MVPLTAKIITMHSQPGRTTEWEYFKTRGQHQKLRMASYGFRSQSRRFHRKKQVRFTVSELLLLLQTECVARTLPPTAVTLMSSH